MPKLPSREVQQQAVEQYLKTICIKQLHNLPAGFGYFVSIFDLEERHKGSMWISMDSNVQPRPLVLILESLIETVKQAPGYSVDKN